MDRRLTLPIALALGIIAARVLPEVPSVDASGEAAFADVIERLDPSVVHVTTQIEGERAPLSRDDAVGAGFVFASDGLIVTSRHILRGARRVRVSVQGKGTFDARVVGQDEATDVALLRIPVTGLPRMAVGDPRALRKGDWVLAAGSPYHLPRSWSVGIVSGLGRSQVGVNLKGFEDFIQTDAAANLGNSGGPLVNARGEVVGMMTAILSRTGRSQGISLAVPIDAVMDSAERLRGGSRSAVRPSLGVIVRELDTRGTGTPGLQVTRFHASSPGREAGLQAGDVIVSVDGVPTARVADLQRVVWAKRAGSTVTVVFVRGGRRLQTAVRLR